MGRLPRAPVDVPAATLPIYSTFIVLFFMCLFY
jgi:hypothetical protein